MGGLSGLWPSPEPVSLGGRGLLAVCFRLRDLARLERSVGVLAGHPLAGRRGALEAARAAAGGDYLGESPECRAYAAALRGGITAAGGWPPPLGSPGAERVLAAGPGLVLWLDLLLARPFEGAPLNPGFTAGEAARLLPSATGEELRHLQAVAYADHPLDELDRLADPLPASKRGPQSSWGERIVRFVEAYPAYTLDAAGDLHLSQWYELTAAGKHLPGQIAGGKARVRRVAARRRRLMAGGT